jgi:haloacetate dehalogenase
MPLLEGFTTAPITVGDVRIHTARGGGGPPVLLMHGYPQTHVTWRRVAPVLARRFTVVCPDLRGYGDSDKPPGGSDHAGYSKRRMALDQVEVMRTLGFERFAVVGHDRGARVGVRMALDHPDAVERLAVLDIVPTRTIYENLDRVRATTVWRYLFLVQPADLPERLIGSDPGFYLRWTFDEWCGATGCIEAEAFAEYERCFDAASIHATCEDYRAGAGIDLVHDAADADTRLACPVLALWSRDGLGSQWDVLGIWARRAAKVRGRALDCGHFLPEERPDDVLEELVGFLAGGGAAPSP